MNIRSYRDSDYTMIASWWGSQGESIPTKNLIPSTTFVLEVENEPIISISVLLTNVKGICFLENFVGNPEHRELRKQYASVIVEHAIDFAKKQGYEAVACFAYKEKTKKRYEQLGMRKTLDNLSSFVREIK